MKKRFRKFPKDKYETLIERGYKYIWNAADVDYYVVDTVNKEFTNGENGLAPFGYMDVINKELNHMSISELIKLKILFK